MVRIGDVVHISVAALGKRGVVNCRPAWVHGLRDGGELHLFIASEAGAYLRTLPHGAVGEGGTWHRREGEGCET